MSISQRKPICSRKGRRSSSMITNCEKTKTFLPYFLNFCSSFMSRIVLPLAYMKFSTSEEASVMPLHIYYSVSLEMR